MQGFFVFLYLAGALTCCIALCEYVSLAITKPIGLPCNSVNYDGYLNVKNEIAHSIYLIGDKEPLLLATGFRRRTGPLSFLANDLRRLPNGTPLHIEFCETQAVRAVAGSVEIFKLTQESESKNISTGRTFLRDLALASLVVSILGMIGARRLNNKT